MPLSAGPLLPDLYSPEEIRMITMFRPILNLPRPLEDSDEVDISGSNKFLETAAF